MRSASFRNVDLTSTSLKSADIAGSDFTGAKIHPDEFLSSLNWQHAKNFHHIPLSPSSLFQGSLDLYLSEEYKQSLVIVDHLLSEYQNDPVYLHLRAAINIQIGEVEDAMRDIMLSSDLYLAEGDYVRANTLNSYSSELSQLSLNQVVSHSLPISLVWQVLYIGFFLFSQYSLF